MNKQLGLVRQAEFAWPDRIFHLFVGGSELHGAKLHGTDDHDLYGLYIEPSEVALGLRAHDAEHFVWSTAGNERCNTSADVDITLYSLRKWAALAAKGNPTALHFLFAANALGATPHFDKLRNAKETFLARQHAEQYLGYVGSMLKRISGKLGRGKKGKRPELEYSHGYDVKAGMHAIRLLYEGIELMKSAKLTLPRPERDLLVAIRNGEWPLDKLLAESQKLTNELRAAADSSAIREHVDYDEISRFVAERYLEQYLVDRCQK